MAYRRIDTQNGVTRMSKELYDNLQDGIDELKSKQFEERIIAAGKSAICDNSKKGGLLFKRIIGKTTQGADPSSTSPKTFTHGQVDVTYEVRNNNFVVFTSEDGSVSSNGIKRALSSINGKYILSGTATSTVDEIVNSVKNPPVGEYFLSGCPDDMNSSEMYLYAKVEYADGKSYKFYDYGSGVVVPINDGATFARVYIYVVKGVTANNVVFRPSLHLNTEYYKYVVGRSKELKFTMTDPLRGIPVFNDLCASYIDKDGKMWCTDELNIDRGVLMRRIGTASVAISSVITLDNGNVAGIQSVNGKTSRSLVGCMCERAIYDKTKSGTPGTFYDDGTKVVFVGNSTDTLDTLKSKYDGASLLYVKGTFSEEIIDSSKLIEVYGLLSHDDTTFILISNIYGNANIDAIVEYPTTDCAGVASMSYNMMKQLNTKYSIISATVE